MKVKDLVLITVLASIQYVVFTSFSFVLYLEFITFVTVLFAMNFKRQEAVLGSIIFVIIYMLTSGITPWSMMYLIVYPTYSLLTSLLKPFFKKHFSALVVTCGFFSFATGQILQIPFLLFSKNITIYYLIAGLKVSIPQGIIAALVCRLLYYPLSKVLTRIIQRRNHQSTIN